MGAMVSLVNKALTIGKMLEMSRQKRVEQPNDFRAWFVEERSDSFSVRVNAHRKDDGFHVWVSEANGAGADINVQPDGRVSAVSVRPEGFREAAYPEYSFILNPRDEALAWSTKENDLGDYVSAPAAKVVFALTQAAMGTDGNPLQVMATGLHQLVAEVSGNSELNTYRELSP